MTKPFIVCLLLLGSSLGISQEQAVEKPSLPELAAESDLVAIAQVTATEYEYTRGFPVSGVATLRILIPYKTPAAFDLIEVAEEGLKETECYFPEVTAWEEGRRFLVFLAHDEGDRFKGHPRGCALPILVTDSNHYAVRIPQDIVRLGEAGEAAVRELVFTDPAARIYTDELTGTSIEAMIEELHLRKVGDDLIYTRGIILTDVRQLIGPEALAPN